VPSHLTDREFANISVASEDGVATIMLDRPERLNAIDHGPGSMHDELVEALRLVDADETLRCSVVRGAGRVFSSGGLLPPGSGNASGAADYLGFLTSEDESNEAIRQMGKPAFAAVHGLCFGSALNMALHLDFIVAAESTRLGFIETRFGSTGAEMLTYFVGPQWAQFLTLSGELVSAPRAASIGLILAAVPDAEFDRRVGDLARRIAAMPEPATVNNRRVLRGALEGMGWAQQKSLALAMNSVTNSVPGRLADGRTFHEIRKSGGMKAFKEARDAPFAESWLDW
jgi:enoyl-CoA hydratase/carnithine racemase